MHGIQPERFATPETQFSLKCRAAQLDFYTHIPTLEFEKSWENRETFREGSLFVSLLGKTDRAKARASLMRPADDSDTDIVEKT